MERKKLVKELLAILKYATLQELRCLIIYAKSYIGV